MLDIRSKGCKFDSWSLSSGYYQGWVTVCGQVNLTLPCLTFGVGRLLHLPSAEAVSDWPNAQPRCNQKVTVIGCEAEQITSHLGLVMCIYIYLLYGLYTR